MISKFKNFVKMKMRSKKKKNNMKEMGGNWSI